MRIDLEKGTRPTINHTERAFLNSTKLGTCFESDGLQQNTQLRSATSSSKFRNALLFMPKLPLWWVDYPFAQIPLRRVMLLSTVTAFIALPYPLRPTVLSVPRRSSLGPDPALAPEHSTLHRNVPHARLQPQSPTPHL